MKKTFFSFVAALTTAVAALVVTPAALAASESSIALDHFPMDRTKNLAALQNGARLFSNYCLSCHSASLMRWNRLRDIGLDEKQIKEFLIFGNQKVGDTMRVSLAGNDAKLWFGKVPPDLSVIARARTSFEHAGTDYLYTLLRGYYRDNSTPTGWNNIVYPNIGMPHILWERQGAREATIERVAHTEGKSVRVVTVYDAAGNANVTTTPLEGHAEEGVKVSFKALDPAAARRFDDEVADLVAYLTFMTDPSASTRIRIGVWVLIFLCFFIAAAWWLNRVYWRDIK